MDEDEYITSKKAWLDKLYYEIGKQQTDFRVCHTFLNKEKEISFTKWKHYLAVADDMTLVKKANQRECLINEIIFDLDNNGDYLALIQRMKADGLFFYAFSTKAGRARHIHTFWEGISQLTKEERKKVREKIIGKYGCDLQLAIDAHMIPIEYAEHWKTGQIKELIDQNEGVNTYISTAEEIEPMRKLKEMLIDTMDTKTNVERFIEICPFFYDKSENFWFWNEGVSKWELYDEVDVMNSLNSMFRLGSSTLKSSVKNEYLEAMRRIGRLRIPPPIPNNWIQFKDKLFDIKDKQIIPATPEYFICNPIPHEMGDTCDTPVIDKLFVEWVGEKWKETLYEVLAYCCITDYPIHIMIGLLGTGRNGKSKFIGLLQKFIGVENCCSTELDDLVSNRFESAKLYKKLVCTMGETNFDVLQNTSRLKKLTGQDLIGFEFKNKTPFNDFNYAKIIISSNNFPDTDDTSDGFYRRWIIIDFPNEFPEGKNILEEIPENEYNNLCCKVCAILPKLIERGLFTNQGTIDERKQRYIMASNPFPDFINRCCIRDATVWMRQNDLKHAYTQYLIANKKRVVNWKGLKDAMEREGISVEKTTKKIGEEFITDRYVISLTLKDKWKDFLTIMPFMPFMPQNEISTHIEEKEMGNSSIKGIIGIKDEVEYQHIDIDIQKDIPTEKDENYIPSPREVVLERLKREKSILITADFEKTIAKMLKDGELYEISPGKVALL